MLSVDDALRQVLQAVPGPRLARVAAAEALGLIMAEPVVSDVDSPPHDKSLVDGYAVIAADVPSGGCELDVNEEVVAGMVPSRPVVRGTATRIMTGAPMPDGADAVVMVEQTELAASVDSTSRVRIITSSVNAGQNIMRRGQSLRRDTVVLTAGRVIRPADIGLLAEVGRTEVEVYRRPQVGVLATGNELVSANVIPSAGQIRNSNGPMLRALVQQAGGDPIDLGIARDDRESLVRRIQSGLAADVLLLSGGVSAGVLDLVPSVLAELGVRQVFHKVHLRPGKPLWFGILDQADRRTLVYGLPGNPVSGLVCFELFVRPALTALLGAPARGPATTRCRLSHAFVHRGERPTYFPGVLDAPADEGEAANADSPDVRLLDWQGSADLRTLTDANVLVCFPAGDRHYQAGDEVRAVRL